jgi:hypothetical protein
MKQFLFLVLFPFGTFAQSATGPNSPSNGSNITGVGTTAWTGAGNIVSSDNTYATVTAANTTTNFLQGRDFNFSLANTDVVAGIRLEVEKRHAPNAVAANGAWTVGTTRPAPGAGTNRCLIVVIGFENSLSRDVASVTYGGQPMTQCTQVGLGTPFYAQTEVWYMLESQLALASGTAITYTFSGNPPIENFEIVSSALFNNVDQLSPFFSSQTNSVNGGAASYTFSPAFNVGEGSMSIYGIFCGAPSTGASTTAPGPVSGFTISAGWTEQLDYHSFSPGFASSGGVLMVATKAQTAAGTEAPASVFNGSANRRTIAAINLRRARNMDNSVRLRKSTGYVGNNNAASLADWSTADAYVSYGSISDLWGASWTYSEINNPNFGAGISAIMQNNGTISVDHMRITVFTTSTLPVELVSFGGSMHERTVPLSWVTASERNLDYFAVERSTDGKIFSEIGRVYSEGTTEQARYYTFTDEAPKLGANYYRLRMADHDGTEKFSDLVSESFSAEDNIVLYPNPASDWAHVLFEGQLEEIVITNEKGAVIDRVTGTTIDGRTDLNLYDMPDGIYFVCIKTALSTTIQKLVKTSGE